MSFIRLKKISPLLIGLVCVVLGIMCLATGCKKKGDGDNTNSGDASTVNLVKGADVGWLPQMEATGYVFYNTSGGKEDCLQILKDKGINSVRLRVFVNPSTDKTNGHCSTSEVVAMAVRAKGMGFRIMIDLHYSDSWADPGQQNKPAAWVNDSFSQLLNDVYNYTYGVMSALKAQGVTPDWVQVGNEITNGMLWPDGSTSNFSQLAQLINKGYDAVKAVSDSSKVVIHLDNGSNNTQFRSFFDNLKSFNGKYDVIGMSYYPYYSMPDYPYYAGQDYTASIDDLGNNLNDMANRYGKQVLVAEIGGPYTAVLDTYNMIVAVENKLAAVPNSQGIGVFYWEPEGAQSWSGYPLCAWGDNAQPTGALNAFSN